MQLFFYILYYPLLLLVSYLPFRLLYILSDFLFLIMYYVIGYRKKVVSHNLKLALPYLTDSERKTIERKSFQHLCDMFLETMKTMSITPKQIDERFVFKNIEVYYDLEKEGKSIALMCAHYASYEWAVSLNKKINLKGYAIYKKISNKYFDQLIRDIRSKFKAYLIHSRESISIIEQNSLNNELCLYGFASDQSPLIKPLTYWSKFLNIEVPIHTGAEHLAKKFDMNVLYLKVEKVKRGHYEAYFEVLSNDVLSIPDYQITDVFMKKVEEQIYAAPEFYMWTHRRFKHMGKNNSN
jgi:KDO2-lipid IV(A) lauroyltransferase